jgi:hypothetical protein
MPADRVSPQPLPVVECRLDSAGLRSQVDRYQALGRYVDAVRRSPGRLEVSFGAELDAALLTEAIEVERECCPFFELSYDTASRQLSISVEDERQDAALDALRFALTAT